MQAKGTQGAAATTSGGGSSLKAWRLAVKKQVNSIRWEMGMLVFVIFYFIVVFLTFAFEDQKVMRSGRLTPPPIAFLDALCHLTFTRSLSPLTIMITRSRRSHASSVASGSRLTARPTLSPHWTTSSTVSILAFSLSFSWRSRSKYLVSVRPSPLQIFLLHPPFPPALHLAYCCNLCKFARFIRVCVLERLVQLRRFSHHPHFDGHDLARRRD
jgi:hypothetical protein